MSELKTCPSCPVRLAADQLELQAEFADERGAHASAERMRTRAAEIRAAGCNWWWRMDIENEQTGQKKTEEGCGREWLPMFLKSYGTDLTRSANMVRRDHETINETAKGLAMAIALHPRQAPPNALPPRAERLLDSGAE